MWANLVVLATLLPMLFHSIVGCCWHHSHSDCQATFFAERPASHACCGQKNGHRQNLRQACHSKADRNAPKMPVGSGQPEPYQDHDPCDGVDCVYLPAKLAYCVLRADPGEQLPMSDGKCIVVAGIPETVQTNVLRPESHYAASRHCALTQVWII